MNLENLMIKLIFKKNTLSRQVGQKSKDSSMEANHMNNEEFDVNGRIFIRSTYMDISVLIDKETG